MRVIVADSERFDEKVKTINIVSKLIDEVKIKQIKINWIFELDLAVTDEKC